MDDMSRLIGESGSLILPAINANGTNISLMLKHIKDGPNSIINSIASMKEDVEALAANGETDEHDHESTEDQDDQYEDDDCIELFNKENLSD